MWNGTTVQGLLDILSWMFYRFVLFKRQTIYAKFNIACPRVNRNIEGGRTFTVTASLEWNKLPLQVRKAETLKTFKNSLWNRIFKDQQSLNHFSI